MGILGFFKGKSKKDEEEIKQKETSEKIIYDQLTDTEDVTLTNFATELLNGNPLVLNFEKLDIDSKNKVLAFLSGAAYAAKGYVEEINDQTYLFGSSDLFSDGSIEEWLKEIT